MNIINPIASAQIADLDAQADNLWEAMYALRDNTSPDNAEAQALIQSLRERIDGIYARIERLSL